MSEQMMAACPAFVADACGGCPCIKIHEKNRRCERSNVDCPACPACTPVLAVEQPARKTVRERIKEEMQRDEHSTASNCALDRCNKDCGQCTIPTAAAERVIEAGDAREEELRHELAEMTKVAKDAIAAVNKEDDEVDALRTRAEAAETRAAELERDCWEMVRIFKFHYDDGCRCKECLRRLALARKYAAPPTRADDEPRVAAKHDEGSEGR